MFYTIKQRNSGGFCRSNEDVAEFLIVESDDVEEAKEKMEEITEDYDNGCSCCGERWSIWALDEGDATECPIIDNFKIDEYLANFENMSVIIYYKDSEKEKIKLKTKREYEFLKGIKI